MSTFSNLWKKLARSKRYREEFVAAQVKRGIPFQARALLKKREGWTQQTLAERSGLRQGAVSRALNPNYGNLTLNTIIRIAAGFDVAFVGEFVPFSELENWFENMSEENVVVSTFEEENEERQTGAISAAAAAAISGSSERLWRAILDPNVLAVLQSSISVEAPTELSRVQQPVREGGVSFDQVIVPTQGQRGSAYEALSGNAS